MVRLSTVYEKIIHGIAYGFGLGLLPKAPGTFGSLGAFPIFWIIKDYPLLIQSAVVLVLSLGGIYLCHKTAKDLALPDHPSIVWDEVCGMLVTLLFVPHTFLAYGLAFGLFRLFDIAKPPPIGWADEHIKGGLGIMVDDLLAGLFAGVCSLGVLGVMDKFTG